VLLLQCIIEEQLEEQENAAHPNPDVLLQLPGFPHLSSHPAKTNPPAISRPIKPTANKLRFFIQISCVNFGDGIRYCISILLIFPYPTDMFSISANGGISIINL